MRFLPGGRPGIDLLRRCAEDTFSNRSISRHFIFAQQIMSGPNILFAYALTFLLTDRTLLLQGSVRDLAVRRFIVYSTCSVAVEAPLETGEVERGLSAGRACPARAPPRSGVYSIVRFDV